MADGGRRRRVVAAGATLAVAAVVLAWAVMADDGSGSDDRPTRVAAGEAPELEVPEVEESEVDEPGLEPEPGVEEPEPVPDPDAAPPPDRQPDAQPAPPPAAAPGTELTATLEAMRDSGVTGTARAVRLDDVRWHVTISVQGAETGARYSVIVTRPPPDGGTPGPTVCSFTGGADRTGTCAGEMEVFENGSPQWVSVMGPTGHAVASGHLDP